MPSAQEWGVLLGISAQTHQVHSVKYCLASPMAQMEKNLPAMQETWARSLGWEDLEEGITTHSSTLAWRIPWTEDPGRPQSIGSQSVSINSDSDICVSAKLLQS